MVRHAPLPVRVLQALSLLVLAAWGSIAVARPANDNFADRIRLSGEDLGFDVDLEGATLEMQVDPTGVVFPLEPTYGWDIFSFGVPTADYGSAWWEWTAPRAGAVLVLPSPSGAQSTIPEHLPEVVIFRTPWRPDPDLPFFSVGYVSDALAASQRSPYTFRYAYPGFHVDAGQMVFLQAFGASGARGHYRLQMTEGPVIFESPVDRTLLLGETSFLNVVASGQSIGTGNPAPWIHYQWFQDGHPLEGETFASLLLSKVGAAAAGSYRVVVTDSEGSVTSAVARVTVSQTEVPPVLLAGCEDAGGGSLSTAPCWTLRGERGRYYVVESSSNLVNWASQLVQPIGLLAGEKYVSVGGRTSDYASQVLLANGSFQFQPRSLAGTLFLRARRYQPVDDTRTALMWIVDMAKEEYGRFTLPYRRITDQAYWTDLAPLIPRNVLPKVIGFDEECGMLLIMGQLEQPSCWPCVPRTPSELLDPFATTIPYPVWNAR